MQVSPYAVVGAHALGSAVDLGEGNGIARRGGDSHVDLVGGEAPAVRENRFHGSRGLLSGENGLDGEQAESFGGVRGGLHVIRIFDAFPQHLIAAADADDAGAGAVLPEDPFIQAAAPHPLQIADGVLGARQNDGVYRVRLGAVIQSSPERRRKSVKFEMRGK
jgi:hypothetical protein